MTVLLTDCPWKHDDALGKRGAQAKYDCMEVPELIALKDAYPLVELPFDCIMLFWRLSNMQEEALEVVRGWGFRIKSEVVTADEQEAGLRRILNFGHTAGHALEAVTKYRRFRHGEAVAYGMLVAAELAVARGVMADADRQELVRMIIALGPLPPVADLSTKEVLEAAKRDKKIVDGTLHFILCPAIGSWTTVTDVTSEELGRALRKIGLKK